MKYSKQAKTAFLFYIGFVTYITIEVIQRGHSHWSMGLVGGVCFLLIGKLNVRYAWELDLVWQMLISAGIITVIELIAGLILNVWLGLGVWDYSRLRFNFMGQISLEYSLLWIPLSLFAIFFDDWLRHFLFGEQQPCYKLFGRQFGKGACKH